MPADRLPGVRRLVQRSARARPLVLFDSWRGAYSDNPRAISEALARARPDLEQTWVGRDVAPGSAAYLRALGAASHVVTNIEMPGYYAKRPGAFYLQTWHGTPLKRIAFDVADPRFAAGRYLTRLRADIAKWDALVSPNPFSTEVFRRAFGYEGRVLETGYPRNDHLAAERAAARRGLGLADGERAILYCPTWRDRPDFDLRLDLAALPGTVLLRLHPHARLDAVPPGVRDVSGHGDMRELLAAADVLITDYSSAMFDFAVTGRPMLFFVDDLAAYRDELRGFTFDFEAEAPGPLLHDTAAVVAALEDLDGVRARYAPAYSRFAERFCSLEDGSAATRVVAAVWGDA